MITTSLLVAYVATIVVANWAISTFGFWPVGFGLMAPAGVYVAGLAFTLRDLLQERGGKDWAIGAILFGTSISILIDPRLGFASGMAFLLSELADFAVYTHLRERSRIGALALSNTVGLALDSALFLMLAFGSLEYLAGQVVGKLWMTALAVALLALVRHRARLGVALSRWAVAL